MRICINHLTRMQTGCICVAGIDEVSGLHIRPVAERQLSRRLLAENGGPLEFSTLLDLGETQFAGRMPEIEDRMCVFDNCQVIRRLTPQELFGISSSVACESLVEIFGDELQPFHDRTFVVPEHRGLRSLGCWWAVGARVVLNEHGKPQVTCEHAAFPLRLPITDIRLFVGDHFQPDLEAIERCNAELASGPRTLVSVGLSRPFRKASNQPAFHWLQINNVLSPFTVKGRP